jgi:hypothetical protein
VNVSEWWLSSLRLETSQGDIYADVPFTAATTPLTFLQYTEIGKGKSGWAETDKPVVQKKTARMHALSAYRPRHGVLLSHDCEIDKARERPRLLFAPVAPIADLPEKTRAIVLAQGHLALAPLPEIPNVGSCYADLRGISTIPTEALSGSTRVASMTDNARLRLGAYMVAFLLRKRLDGTDVHN